MKHEPAVFLLAGFFDASDSYSLLIVSQEFGGITLF